MTPAPADTKEKKAEKGPTVEERLDRIEAALGLGAHLEPEPLTAPEGPPRLLYERGEEEE